MIGTVISVIIVVVAIVVVDIIDISNGNTNCYNCSDILAEWQKLLNKIDNVTMIYQC